MGLHRMYNILPKFIEYYPNLKIFAMSTNFTIPNWFEEFFGFLNVLGQYPYRQFTFNLQLSIDGPEYINDANRGKNVTKLFLDHYYEFINKANLNIPNNVNIKAHFKQTYSNQTIDLLQDKEKIIEYFTFFDNLISDFNETINNPKIKIYSTVPNTAAPAVHTKYNGIQFANYCKLTKEIEKEKHFKNYNNISTYTPHHNWHPCENTTKCNLGGFHCGAGISNIGLLPNNYISLCHVGFANLLEEYKINSKKNHVNENDDDNLILKALYTNNSEVFPTCIPFEDYPKIKDIFISFYNHNQTFQMTNTIALIQSLALVNQIEERFKNYDEAHKAAQFLLNATPLCTRDNANVTGSITMTSNGYAKLLFNGAYEYLIGEK